MCNPSMKELIIVVNIVTIKQQQKAAFEHMCNMSMKELNYVVNIVNMKQQQKATFKDMWNLSMKEINLVVIGKNYLLKTSFVM